MKGYANCSDDMLVQAYMEGKDSAFDELLARNQQQLFDFILALTRDKDKADDLFQETFIRAIVKMKDGQQMYIRIHCMEEICQQDIVLLWKNRQVPR